MFRLARPLSRHRQYQDRSRLRQQAMVPPHPEREAVCPLSPSTLLCANNPAFARAAKRSDPGFFIGNRIRTCVSDDVDEAKAVLRKTMAHYWAMPNYRNYWREAGYVEEMTAIEAAVAAGRQSEIPSLMSERWLADATLYGPAARIREGVEEWRAAGITTPVVVPLSPDGDQMNGLKAVLAAFER